MPLLCVNEIRFLGKRVNGDGIGIDDAKISKVLDFPAPPDRRAVQRFLGLCVYHHAHIQDYGRASRPLYDLLLDNAEWKWGAEEHAAFEKLKQGVANAAFLEFPE